MNESSFFGITKGETCDTFRMPNQLLPDFVFTHSPDPRFAIGAHSNQELIVTSEVAVPNPAWVPWQHSILRVLLCCGHIPSISLLYFIVGINPLYKLKLVYFTGSVWGAGRKILVISRKLAFQYVILGVRLYDLHGNKFTILLLP